MAVTQLGLFLTETYKAEKRKERPLVLGVLLDTGKYLVVGITGSTDGKANKNMFGRAYRKAATRVGATLQYDGFDSWVVSECTHPLLRPKRARLVPIVTLQYRSLSRTRGFISGWSRSTHSLRVPAGFLFRLLARGLFVRYGHFRIIAGTPSACDQGARYELLGQSV